MKKSTKICLIIFLVTFIVIGIGGTVINILPPNVSNPQTLSKFENIIGTDNYNQLTSEYKILFIDKNKNSGEIYTLWKQIRIDNSLTEKQQLIALCHEYGHYLTIKYNLTKDKLYQNLFETKEEIWYDNYNMTSTAYQNIDEFCASYIGMWYYNTGKYDELDNRMNEQ